FFFFFQAEDGIRDFHVTGVQTCALPIWLLKPENVGYNISYVDHVYMPVAIGPKNNPYIGYSGSTQPLANFRNELAAFVADGSVRSEERRVGKEGTSRWWGATLRKKKSTR